MRTRMAFLRKFVWGLVACVGTVSPAIGWGITLSDKPLFLESNVAHNLLFVVDDSGSMDYEVLAPAVGVAGDISSNYIFNLTASNANSPYNVSGTGNTRYDFNARYYYLRSSDYNRS